MKILLVPIFAVAVALAGCRRTDVRDFTVSIPGLTAADHAVIVEALAPYGGVLKDTVKFDDDNDVLTLRYDSMQIAKKNIEMAIAARGLEANGVTPESVGATRRKSAK